MVRDIRNPVCSDFGSDRKIIFKGYHLFSNWKNYDVEKGANPKQKNLCKTDRKL